MGVALIQKDGQTDVKLQCSRLPTRLAGIQKHLHPLQLTGNSVNHLSCPSELYTVPAQYIDVSPSVLTLNSWF
jgi:hypothetical protein